jgi:hypothetical protein
MICSIDLTITLASLMLAERLQRIAIVLAENAFMREMEVASPRDETAWMKDYDETLRRIDEVTAEEEALLRERDIDHAGALLICSTAV